MNFKKIKPSFEKLTANKKRLIVGIIVAIVAFSIISSNLRNKSARGSNAKIVTTQVNKSFDFVGLNNAGKAQAQIIKLTVTGVDKTNQVQVKEQIFEAKNQKLFMIVNLELKNDATVALNLIPGDLIRMSIDGDGENKFAPDLHNNLVPIAPISTRIDRVGFVIPQEANKFTLFIGELEGAKEEVQVQFAS